MEELRRHAEAVCTSAGVPAACRDYVSILINNEAWRDSYARVPYDRRLLLMPQCLRSAGDCPATIDEFGLVCEDCGRCPIHELQTQADRLGYAVLVAEGSAVVLKLIQTGQIQAVLGVSCMSVLERCFPHMQTQAVPGMAVPLLRDGCENTTVDTDWVAELIHLTSQEPTVELDLNGLKGEVRGWFAPESLISIVGPPTSETAVIALDWLSRAGKRWRPYLTACVYTSLQGDVCSGPPELDDDLKKLAVAVECFHKASLIHDDIEDGDAERYGHEALHIEHGMPVALNVGDFLLGEGYRLIGELGVDDEIKVAMLRTAASGHVMLSRGQGAELCWARSPRPLSQDEVLDIFRQKTAPAFEVALRLGAFYGHAEPSVHDVLTRYSEALGIAYQIRDDLEDFSGTGDSNDLLGMRPSVLLAMAHERAERPAEAALTTALWSRTCDLEASTPAIERLIAERDVVSAVHHLLTAHMNRATDALRPLASTALKSLLRRVVGRIFASELIQGYCSEPEAGHDPGRAAGARPVG